MKDGYTSTQRNRIYAVADTNVSGIIQKVNPQTWQTILSNIMVPSYNNVCILIKNQIMEFVHEDRVYYTLHVTKDKKGLQ